MLYLRFVVFGNAAVLISKCEGWWFDRRETSDRWQCAVGRGALIPIFPKNRLAKKGWQWEERKGLGERGEIFQHEFSRFPLALMKDPCSDFVLLFSSHPDYTRVFECLKDTRSLINVLSGPDHLLWYASAEEAADEYFACHWRVTMSGIFGHGTTVSWFHEKIFHKWHEPFVPAYSN